MYLRLVLAIATATVIDAHTTSKTCRVNIDRDLATPQPLYFYYNSTDFVETTVSTSEFDLNGNQKIELFCSDGFRKPYVDETLTAACISGNNFRIENKSANLIDAMCNNYPNHTTRVTKRKCAAGKTVEIGFDVRGTWIPILEFCHDGKTATTKWVHHQLKPNNNRHQRNVDRIFFIQGDFYEGLKVDRLYTRVIQKKTIGQILDSDELAGEIIADDSDLYLARGHLAAKSDYVFASHQVATFYFINAAPQWQSFNNGNWLKIEIGIKNFIEKRNIETDVYTGTHGIFKFPDIHGKQRKIYLAWNQTESLRVRKLPVPLFLYKVVIAESIGAGIVLIGVNNPYVSQESIDKEHILCPDVSEQVKYIGWDRANLTAGFCYACSVSNFVKVVKDLPKLPKVSKLLI